MEIENIRNVYICIPNLYTLLLFFFKIYSSIDDKLFLSPEEKPLKNDNNRKIDSNISENSNKNFNYSSRKDRFYKNITQETEECIVAKTFEIWKLENLNLIDKQKQLIKLQNDYIKLLNELLQVRINTGNNFNFSRKILKENLQKCEIEINCYQNLKTSNKIKNSILANNKLWTNIEAFNVYLSNIEDKVKELYNEFINLYINNNSSRIHDKSQVEFIWLNLGANLVIMAKNIFLIKKFDMLAVVIKTLSQKNIVELEEAIMILNSKKQLYNGELHNLMEQEELNKKKNKILLDQIECLVDKKIIVNDLFEILSVGNELLDIKKFKFLLLEKNKLLMENNLLILQLNLDLAQQIFLVTEQENLYKEIEELILEFTFYKTEKIFLMKDMIDIAIMKIKMHLN